jgi:hypothetical protein
MRCFKEKKNMKRIPMILVLLLAFTFIAAPALTPAAAMPVAPTSSPVADQELAADSDPGDTGGKGDPGGLGDGLGADDPTQMPLATIDGCEPGGWDELEDQVLFLLLVMMMAD